MNKKLVIILFFSINLFSQSEKIDARIYKVLQKEVGAAERLIRGKKNDRNYFRLFNSRLEILKFKGKKLRELKFKDKNSSAVKSKTSENFKYYKETKKYGDIIYKNYLNLTDKGKFYLLHGLMIAEYEPNDKSIEPLLKRAVKYIDNKNLKSVAAGNLADYFYNNAIFDKAIKAYSMALKINPRTEWKDRYLYNQSWCYFKKDLFDDSVNNLIKLYKTTKQKNNKNYFYTQSRKKIPEMYVFSKKPDAGLNFLLTQGNTDTDSLLSFSKYVYEKGFFKEFNSHIAKIEQFLKNKNRSKDLLSFRVDTFNFLVDSEFKKSNRSMTALRNSIMKYYKSGQLSSEQKKIFKEKNIDLLNKNIKYVNDKKTKKEDSFFKPILKDSINLVNTLKAIDPKKSSDYDFKLAQMFAQLNQEDKSIKIFERIYKADKKKDPKKAAVMLEEILAYYDKKNIQKGIIAPKTMSYYQDYLKHGSKKKIKKTIYLRLYDKYFKEKQYSKNLEMTDLFYKLDKKDKKSEALILNLIAVEEINKDEKFYNQIKEFVNTRPELAQSSSLQKALREGYKLVSTQKINSLLDSGDGEDTAKADKLYAFFKDTKLDLNNRLISGFNALVLYKKANKNKVALEIVNNFINKTNAKKFIEYKDRIEALAKSELFSDVKFFEKTYSDLFTRACKEGLADKNRHYPVLLEMYLSQGNLGKAFAFQQKAKSCSLDGKNASLLAKLSREYVDWSDSSNLREYVSLVSKHSIFSRKQINSFIEEYFIYKINNLETVDEKKFGNISSEIAQDLGAFNIEQRAYYKIYNRLFKLGAAKISYNKTPLSDANVAGIVEKNFKLFAKRLKDIDAVKTDIPFLVFFKKIVENTIFNEFVFIFENLKYIDEAKSGELKKLIAGAVAPFKKKHALIKKAVESNLKKKIRLRYLSLKDPNYIIYRGGSYKTINL